MVTIDSHIHFWRFDPVKDNWMNDGMYMIKRDFLPEDLTPLLNINNITGCIAVQAAQSEEENVFLMELAAVNPFVKGIVGWVDLMANDIHEKLGYFKQYDIVKGFRHILQDEYDRSLMLKPGFKRGIEALSHYGYTYDILIYPDQLTYAEKLVKMFPHQRFVIDHLAKPRIKEKEFYGWKKDIQALSRHRNVCCKISGMVTEADWKEWIEDDIKPYLDVVFEAFGIKRVMYGSDWPVCLLAGGYQKMIGLVHTYIAELTQNEQELFWGQNAISFYNLKDPETNTQKLSYGLKAY